MAHLMRRAGFGATRKELDEYSANGYEATVEHLLEANETKRMSDEMIWRYHHEQSGMMGQINPTAYWLYRMISTDAPLREKVTLFWHNIFATGYPKIAQGRILSDQINMFRRHGMGNFKNLLIELSKNPAMISWLDNHDNHNGAINENYGRELLELFSMGVGNYSEDDIKECSRAFTGWTIGNTEYMILRAERDSIWPYGRIGWFFQYNAEDHDDGEKQFLGHKGKFNGEDIIDIICQQQATARFIARHMYHFFVADEPPVPQWPYTAPRDPEAIDLLAKTYFDSGYDITEMLRVLFNSDFFKSEEVRYSRVKSPAELVAGVLRLSGEFNRPRREILDRALQMIYMGQHLTNPPSVEGWHQGTEWIDTGTLVERLNFASAQLGDVSKSGVKSIISEILNDHDDDLTPEELVESCLDQLGLVSVSDSTHDALIDFASKGGSVTVKSTQSDGGTQKQIARMMQLIGTSYEFQRA
jgi:uncharacterized protein (DUF1800 family)